MLQAFSALLSILNRISAYFLNKQQIDAGKAEQTVAEAKEVQANVQKAQEAVSTPDPTRDDRLRKRFNRSSGQ